MSRLKKLDGKVYGTLVQAKDDRVIPDDEYIVFRPHDNRVPAMLKNYHEQLVATGADNRQVSAFIELMRRVDEWREANPDRCKEPDVDKNEKLLW